MRVLGLILVLLLGGLGVSFGTIEIVNEEESFVIYSLVWSGSCTDLAWDAVNGWYGILGCGQPDPPTFIYGQEALDWAYNLDPSAIPEPLLCSPTRGGLSFAAGWADWLPADPPPDPACGDESCNGDETCESCVADCGECAPAGGDDVTVLVEGITADGWGLFDLGRKGIIVCVILVICLGLYRVWVKPASRVRWHR